MNVMKLGRFLFGVATGVAAGYLINKATQKTFVKPEKVVHMLKNRYKDKMSIIGSWIHVEPQCEEINGIQYNIYQGGLTGVVDGSPQFLEFTVDADTGTLLKVES
jgi:predicted small secreted protein